MKLERIFFVLAVRLPLSLFIKADLFLSVYPSDLTTAAFAGKDGSKKGSFPADSIPATRAGTEEDIAGAILFLVSRAGAYCNGCVMLSDGGRTGIFPSSF